MASEPYGTVMAGALTMARIKFRVYRYFITEMRIGKEPDKPIIIIKLW
jgi:hypothetical protein